MGLFLRFSCISFFCLFAVFSAHYACDLDCRVCTAFSHTHRNYTDESMPVNMCTTVCYSTGYNNKMQSKEQYDKSLNLANEMHKICNQNEWI